MSDFIGCYDGMLDAALCREVIARFQADPRRSAGQIRGRGSPKQSTDLHIRGLPEWADLCARLDVGVVASLRRYREEFANFRDIHREIRDTGYQVQAYQPNGVDGFDWHADARDAGTCHRFLAMIAYLDDVEVGGETEFRAQGRKIAPRAGRIAWFPPGFEYVHRGNPPISGPKHVITLFLVYP